MNKDILATLKYYAGEQKCPDSKDPLCWTLEQQWCQTCETEYGKKVAESYLSDYLAQGLREFEYLDGTPLALKAFLFARTAKDSWSQKEAIEGFKKWYTETYKGSN